MGHDHDRGALRTFRLSRIAGPVVVTGQPRSEQPPADFDVRSFVSGADEPQVRARFRVAAGRAAALRRRAERPVDGDTWTADEITVVGSSIDELAALACAAGRDAVVIEPAELAEAVVAALTAIVDAHAEAAS